MNPELEPQPVECPNCDGRGIVYPNDRMMRASCLVCDGTGSITQDAADQRDAAAEANWENQRDK